MPRFLDRVGDVVGRRLSASPQYRERVMMTEATNVSKADLLKRIASAVGGKWAARGDGLRLESGDRLPLTREQELRQVRLGIGKLAGLYERQWLAAQPPFDAKRASQLWRRTDPPDASRFAREFDGPATRAFEEELAAADPSWFADMSLKTSNKFQDAIGRAVPDTSSWAREMVRRFKRYQDIWVNAIDPRSKSLPHPDYNDPRQDQRKATSDKITVYDWVLYDGPEATASPYEGFFPRLVVCLYDENGRKLGQYDSLSWILPGGEARSIAEVDARLPAGPVRLEGSSIRFAQLFGRPDSSPLEQQGDRDQLGRLIEPDRFEPLALFVGPVLEALAHGTHRNLVAAVPDSLFRLAPLVADHGRTGISVEALESEIEAFGGEIESSGGWLQIGSAHGSNESREALASLLSSIRKEGFLDRAALAKYVAASPWRDAPTLLADRYLSAIAPAQAAQVRQVDWSLMNFYAAVPASLRASLLKGPSFSVEEAGPQALDRYLHLVQPVFDHLVPIPEPQTIRPLFTEDSVRALNLDRRTLGAPFPASWKATSDVVTVRPDSEPVSVVWYGATSSSLGEMALSRSQMAGGGIGPTAEFRTWRMDKAFDSFSCRVTRPNGETVGWWFRLPSKNRLAIEEVKGPVGKAK